MSVAIREATSDDAGAVVRLEQELFGTDAWSDASVLSELTGEHRRSFVAADPEQTESVVGYAVVALSFDVADLQRIGVRASHQRRGVARELLQAATATARDEGAHRMLLEVSSTNRAALAFYARAGFVEIDRRARYYRDGTDAVVMRASLGTAACGKGA